MYTEIWATLNPGEMVVAVKKIGNARPFRIYSKQQAF